MQGDNHLSVDTSGTLGTVTFTQMAYPTGSWPVSLTYLPPPAEVANDARTDSFTVRVQDISNTSAASTASVVLEHTVSIELISLPGG